MRYKDLARWVGRLEDKTLEEKKNSPVLGLEPRTFTLGGRWNIHFPIRAIIQNLMI